jgi:hypothetical protein
VRGKTFGIVSTTWAIAIAVSAVTDFDTILAAAAAAITVLATRRPGRDAASIRLEDLPDVQAGMLEQAARYDRVSWRLAWEQGHAAGVSGVDFNGRPLFVPGAGLTPPGGTAVQHL